MLKTFTDPITYGYAVGRIRVRETRLLTKEFFRRLIEAKNFLEQLNLLAETEYSSAFEEFEEVAPEEENRWEELVEEALEKGLELTYGFLEEVSPLPEIVNFFRLKYDFHNLKILLKSKFQVEVEVREDLGLNLGLIRFPELKMVIEEEKGGEIGGIIGNIYRVLARAAKEALQFWEETKNPLVVDLILDEKLNEYCYEVISSLKSSFLLELFQKMVDLANIKAFLRAKALELPKNFFSLMLRDYGFLRKDLFSLAYENSPEKIKEATRGTFYQPILERYLDGNPENLPEFDVAGDNLIMDHLRQGRYITVGPEPMVVYIFVKELEVKLLRIILLGRLNGVPKEKIEFRIRMLYG